MAKTDLWRKTRDFIKKFIYRREEVEESEKSWDRLPAAKREELEKILKRIKSCFIKLKELGVISILLLFSSLIFDSNRLLFAGLAVLSCAMLSLSLYTYYLRKGVGLLKK